ncbi:HAD family phosphatase [Tumebacillus sp. ITR2]|uniref:HAD family phosphatase n=1 Tax=Tumebacillus amylolyticus TaxID=2801339 RepID=A0ABS1JBH1_9BACL|nr:Cof-type HAD-IIB family hydrolase [Tumebacillus amylolyticus]MBL0387617.1 HAD family phosphatase [Tumebacillus amylolyticus]
MSQVITVEQSRLVEQIQALPEQTYKLVAFDMDGTLLNAEHALSERTIKAVQAAAEQGLHVLLATGRMASAVRTHLDLLKTPGLVVSHNGAVVKDLHTQEIWHSQSIAQNVVDHVLTLVEKVEVTALHFNYDEEILLVHPNPHSDDFARDLGVELTYVTSLRERNEGPTSILFMDRKSVCDELLASLQEACPDGFDYVLIPWNEERWQFQLLPTQTSKGHGVLRVAEKLGISPAEIISFGDSYNDLEMISETGLGIAMGNAVPELKHVARLITLSHEQDGVAVALEALLERGRR